MNPAARMTSWHAAGLDRSGATAGREGPRVVHATFVPMGQQERPEEVADAVAFLTSDDSRYTTGAALMVDGDLTAR